MARRRLQRRGLLLPLTVLLASVAAAPATSSSTTFDVVVVGAGASGLGAAATLQAAGARVVVLEARNRTGGRVWTVDRQGVKVDLGGWVAC